MGLKHIIDLALQLLDACCNRLAVLCPVVLIKHYLALAMCSLNPGCTIYVYMFKCMLIRRANGSCVSWQSIKNLDSQQR